MKCCLKQKLATKYRPISKEGFIRRMAYEYWVIMRCCLRYLCAVHVAETNQDVRLCGPRFATIDMEHTYYEMEKAAELAHSGESAGLSMLVQVPALDAV